MKSGLPKWKLAGSLGFLTALACFAAPESTAQSANPYVATNSGLLSPVTLHSSAQYPARPDPAIIPTDQTSTHIGDERQLFSSPLKFTVLEKLPERMYFTSVTEVTQRFESNVLSSARNPRRDYVFRVLPNVTLGYNLRPTTSIYANYFMIKDVFANTSLLNRSTFQSLSGGIQQDVRLGQKTNMQLNFQARQLWQARGLYQADLLPGVTLTHAFTPRAIGFFNSQLQMRSQSLFEGPTREIDPFYTIGLVLRRGVWSLTSTGTLVNNYRNRNAIPPISNNAIICDFELARPVSRKRLPGVDMFVRAEPIWNWGAHGAPGLSGFDFRIFSGLRLTVAKPSIYPQMEYLRKQLREAEKSH